MQAVSSALTTCLATCNSSTVGLGFALLPDSVGSSLPPGCGRQTARERPQADGTHLSWRAGQERNGSPPRALVPRPGPPRALAFERPSESHRPSEKSSRPPRPSLDFDRHDVHGTSAAGSARAPLALTVLDLTLARSRRWGSAPARSRLRTRTRPIRVAKTRLPG